MSYFDISVPVSVVSSNLRSEPRRLERESPKQSPRSKTTQNNIAYIIRAHGNVVVCVVCQKSLKNNK
jgi:hypothetical protein